VSMLPYKGYHIFGSAMAGHPNDPRWRSHGSVCTITSLNSVIEVKRLEGLTFETKQQAEEHGLALCKVWIDEYQELGKQLDELAREFKATHEPGVWQRMEQLSDKLATLRKG
jgi:hypothetical protein